MQRGGAADGAKLWEYSVRVTDVPYPLEAVAQLYLTPLHAKAQTIKVLDRQRS